MEVTKHNYEEFALDYLEGTLAEPERKAFERFLEGQPEIAVRVESLREGMPVLAPDPSVRYPDKASLKRRASLRPSMIRVASVAAVLVLGVWLIQRYRPAETGPIQPSGQPLVSQQTVPADPAEKESKAPESDGEVSTPPLAGTAPQLLADARPAPVNPVRKTPAETVARTVPGESGKQLTPDLSTVKPVPATASNERNSGTPAEAAPATAPETEPEQIREVFTAPPVAEEVPAAASVRQTTGLGQESALLAEAPEVQVVSVTEELLIGEIDLTPDVRDYFAEEKNPAGFLNVLSRKGFRKLAADILTPLSEISPFKVYENSEERVVEFASIPISRKSNKTEE